jgi:hypothetical protein
MVGWVCTTAREEVSVTAPSDSFSASFPFWPWSFNQPILPGWTFNNITVNDKNSSAPATEFAIVAEESCGRQIGKLLDAVAALIEWIDEAKGKKVFTDLLDLQNKVEAIKTQSAKRSIQQVTRDLQRLKDNDLKAYKEEIAALR